MSNKRKIEIFTAGCPVCSETVDLVKRIACNSCEVEVLDMHQANVAKRAGAYGISSVPSIVIDGKLANCCSTSGVNEQSLRAEGVGVPLS